jgi:2-polyprenyl-3-methyl-5-hydroxy-6-metoxy-1,4-benzoquinol methylase
MLRRLAATGKRIRIMSEHDPAEDLTNGYEAIADRYIAARAGPRPIGIDAVLRWARTLPRGATILDVGCGPGVPVSQTLMKEGFTVYGVDASPRMVAAFRQRFPDTPCECSSVQRSNFFNRQFDAAIAWGLIFLLLEHLQPIAIANIARALKPGGRFVFTAPREIHSWTDNISRVTSYSLGEDAYRAAIEAAGLRWVASDVDVGNSHYYWTEKPPAVKADESPLGSSPIDDHGTLDH